VKFEIGLNERELEIYSTLVERGPLTARDLADHLKIPHTKVYEYINRLEKMGAIKRIGGRPVKYAATPPLELYGKLINNINNIIKNIKQYFEFLQSVYELKYNIDQPFITILKGDKVISMVSEVLRSSDVEVYLALPFEEFMTYEFLYLLEEESKKRLVRLLTTKNIFDKLKLPPRIEIRILDDMFGGGIIGNSTILFVKHKGELLGIYSNDKYILDVARTYFNHLWNKSLLRQ